MGYGVAGPVSVALPSKGTIAIRVRLPPAAIVLDGVVVRASAVESRALLMRVGFSSRRVRRPFGMFYTSEELKDGRYTSLSMLLRRLPGVVVMTSNFGSPLLALRGTARLHADGSRGLCGPRVTLNGMTVHDGGVGNPALIDDIVDVGQIVGMEIYRSAAEVPVDFAFGTDACGAVVIWTY